MSSRLEKAGVPPTYEMRAAYREILGTAPGLGETVSGIILFDETIRQVLDDGTPFADALTAAGVARARTVRGHSPRCRRHCVPDRCPSQRRSLPTNPVRAVPSL